MVDSIKFNVDSTNVGTHITGLFYLNPLYSTSTRLYSCDVKQTPILSWNLGPITAALSGRIYAATVVGHSFAGLCFVRGTCEQIFIPSER